MYFKGSVGTPRQAIREVKIKKDFLLVSSADVVRCIKIIAENLK